ncbi:hypothetical protein [Haloferula sp.]|uniref:hypothetical protein n=1 Tax=Haloferula sp. TaxID=2497595 RepID=UPI00329AB2EA
MKSLSALFLSAFALIASAIPASSEVIMVFSTGGDFLQRGKFALDFRGGDLYVGFRDGNAVLAPCLFDPSSVIVTPNIFCPIGTTGFIANGDFDGDGVRDDLSFYSISQVIPAILVEPFRPDLCELISAPYSDLPRPLGPFVDRGAIIFFNILTASVYQYNVSMYEFARNYPAGPAGRNLMDSELVYGTYIFVFPRLDATNLKVPIAVSYTAIPEAFNAADRYQVNPFRVTSGVYDSNGNYLMDHRLTTEVTWVGNDVTNTSPFTDEMRISILDEDEENVLFPPKGEDLIDPDTGEVIVEGDVAASSLVIPSPLDTNYFLPPLLTGLENADNPENVFGEEAFFRLRFARVRGTSGISFDTSTRIWSFKLRYVDSYQGFRISAFPTGVSQSLTVANGDFDGDGQKNIDEYALGSDPANPASMHADLTPTVEPDGKVSFTMTKRPNGAARYQFNISTNGGRFKTIGTNDPVWEVTQDDEIAYVITTRDVADPDDYEAEPQIAEIVVN